MAARRIANKASSDKRTKKRRRGGVDGGSKLVRANRPGHLWTDWAVVIRTSRREPDEMMDQSD